MGLLILGSSITEYDIKGQYFGTDRTSPNYIDRPEAIEANRLWKWYVDNVYKNNTLSLSDQGRASKLVQEYRKWGIEFQIIETAPKIDGLQLGRFIGYDLSLNAGISLLSWGLTYHNRMIKDPKKDILRPITLLTEKYFQPLLNEYGLFSDLETASFLFEVLCAIQRFLPNAFEADEVIGEFKPIALGIVDEST